MKKTKASEEKKRLVWALKKLKMTYPEVKCALHYKNPYELTVATILSAQCTDERVNQVTPRFFEKYPDSKSLSQANVEDVEKVVYSTGFYKNKAKNLVKLAQRLQSDFQGEVPQNLSDLESCPGVGRKTANVVLGNAFGIASGIAVDTHVTRLMNLFAITKTENATKIESRLKELVPKSEWINFTHYFIAHGRKVCIARRPHCQECVISKLCPSKNEVRHGKKL